MEQKFIQDKQGNKQLPITHMNAVRDSQGNTLTSLLGAFEDEVRGLVSTPHQGYVTVATYSALPAEGSEDTIYRVSNYDGSQSQVNPAVYSEYAWDGTQYVFLRVKDASGEVFDITEYNSNTKYADLAAALGTDGANIPQNLRKGGMSVKFVQSSDNKYIHYNLIANEFTTDVAQWQGVDDEPTAGSDNLVKSGGVAKISMIEITNINNNDFFLDYSTGKFQSTASNKHSCIEVKQGETYYLLSELANCAYAFATSDTAYGSQTIPVVNGTSVMQTGAANTYTKLIVPADCYLLFNQTNYNTRLFKEYKLEDILSEIDKVNLREDEVSYYNVSENVPLESGYYTLATAIAAVPQKIKKGGLVITFTTGTGWDFYRYGESKYTNETNWNNTSHWYKIISKQLFCANSQSINFDLVNKKLTTNAYSDTTLVWEGGTYVIPRGSEFNISSSYSNYVIVFDIVTKTFSTQSISDWNLNNNLYIFAFVLNNIVICPVTSNYSINNYSPYAGLASKGDVAYVANITPAVFDLYANTLTFSSYPDTTKVYANGRIGYFSNNLTVNLVGNAQGVIVFDFADNTFKTYIRTSAYTAPLTSVLVGWYDLTRKAAFLNGKFNIQGQYDYWDYADLPTYIKDGISAHIAKVCQGVENNDLVFDFITDVQSNEIYTGSRICYIEAINAGMKVGKFVVNGGDFVSGLPTASDDIDHMSRMYQAHKRGIGSKDLFMCQGNHDGTWLKWNSTSHQVKAKDIVTDKTWTNMFLKNIDGAVYDAANPLGGYLYKDYEDKKVRVIILNTCDICVYDENGYLKYNAMYNNAVRQQQLDWLVNYALDFTDKGADKTNWGILVFTHFGVDVDNDWFPHGAVLVENVLQAFRTGSAINQSSEWGTDFQLLVNHDFSTQGAMNYIAYIHGHTHTDRVLFNNGVPHIATASANGYYDHENPPVGGTCPERIAATLSYYCYDTMQYNKQNKEIIAYRFGAGNDRYINLGADNISIGETTTLTTKLSGTITWTAYSLSNANIASVSDGVVTGIAQGNATICAQDEVGNKEFFGIVVS